MVIRKAKWIRIKRVVEIIPVSKTAIWLWVREGKFPQPVKFGERVTVWDEEEVQQWGNNMVAKKNPSLQAVAP